MRLPHNVVREWWHQPVLDRLDAIERNTRPARRSGSRPMTSADIAAAVKEVPSRWDAWKAAGYPTPIRPGRPTGRCTRCGTTANLFTNGDALGFLDGHHDAEGKPCLYSFTASHDNAEMLWGSMKKPAQ